MKNDNVSELDYGIFQLSKEGIEKIEEFYEPCSLCLCDNVATTSPPHVFGYPVSRNKQKPHSGKFVGEYVHVKSSLIEKVPGCHYKKDRNIALSYTIDSVIRTKNISSVKGDGLFMR